MVIAAGTRFWRLSGPVDLDRDGCPSRYRCVDLERSRLDLMDREEYDYDDRQREEAKDDHEGQHECTLLSAASRRVIAVVHTRPSSPRAGFVGGAEPGALCTDEIGRSDGWTS
jgi:hypothetical protein